ncbi:MAG: hypothetical protein ABSC06_00770 [Rhodopila sp.]|jgi:hypothetical protein
MINRDYHHAGHSPPQSAASFYSAVHLMVQALPGLQSAHECLDNAAKKAPTVPLPLRAVAFPGLVNDAPADLTAPKPPGKVGPPILLSGPLTVRLHGPDSDPQVPLPGVVPAAAASFAVTLPPKCWPPEQPRTAGVNNPGTAFGARI